MLKAQAGQAKRTNKGDQDRLAETRPEMHRCYLLGTDQGTLNEE